MTLGLTIAAAAAYAVPGAFAGSRVAWTLGPHMDAGPVDRIALGVVALAIALVWPVLLLAWLVGKAAPS